ncbi:hypothetical protein AA0111_g12693 [Alternaria arborescens]|uniref:hypothetical protein n=1 Tax=Alternaria arborescens TaxID=156630 RepID=UPI0010756C71|nr:hypothetical protein AA0111_g12693 [Alternaria arborescens]RYO11928.1 hypothetical protein AA0111_g12693 [Alternaria arborescens]
MAKSTQSNPREVPLRDTSPLHLSKNDWGGIPVPISLIHRLEFCLSTLSSQSTQGFRIPLVIKTHGVATNINIDVYDKSQTLPTDSGTTQLEPSLGDIKISEPELRSEQLQLPPQPSLRQILKVRRRLLSSAMKHDNMDAVMDQQPITTIEDSETETDELTFLTFSPSKDLAHSSSKDEAKLMGHRKSDHFHELIKVEPSKIKAEFSKIEAEFSEIKAEASEIKAEVSEIEAAFSKKRKNPDDDASHYSGVLVDSSDEENDSEGILDTTRISTDPKEMAIPVIVPKHEKVDPVRKWLYEHPACPYPTMDEKIGLATAAGLTTQRLSCRLANLRLRLRRELHELATYTDIDTYNTPRPKSQTLLTSSGTTQFQPCLDDVTKSDPRTILRSSTHKNLVHPSSKDKAKLMNYQGYNTTDGPDKARVSKKRVNSDDDASHCSEAFSSEEGDDSDYEWDNIITWNYSQHDALLSFLPYIRGYDENTSPPCSDSPESGSTTSGTTSDTPASSSASSLSGGTDPQGNGYTPPSAGTGFPDNGSNPVLGTKEGFGAKVAVPRPLPLICWYSAAGIACNAKHVSSSCKTRYLWCDHAWGKDEGLNHRLSDACQRCKRLFLTEELLEEHHGTCRKLIPLELEELNRIPNRLGISRECKKAIEVLRKRIEKETKGGKPPALHDDDTMTLLEQRVDSNVSLYINGSNASEKTARSELWKWYFIFKKLRPDDELPRNPFLPAQQPLGLELSLGEKPRADARLMFMCNLNQDERLSKLDNDQRTALGRVFLNTLEMLGLNQANNRRRTAQNSTRNPRKRQRISPPESCERAPDSTYLTPAPTTPALAPAPIPMEVPPSVRNPVNFQHSTFTPAEVQNRLLPQIPSSVPQSFMPSTDNLWLLQQQQQPQQQLQQQQEAENDHSLLPMGDLGYINSWIGYDELTEFGTRDY